MIVGHETRLGKHSADEIKNHPFFAGVDWNTIRNIESPFIPHLRFVVLYFSRIPFTCIDDCVYTMKTDL